ncbi:HEPN family nuclease [uncultured Alistipes sp.]|uniref:HEPN family nuclease n=1 Tax=uncultured Alistipes sp. TaxID=538949 RepID=UPI00272BA131|nr:HEPN family nuclease [uncultured Alistipes sp.]
MAHEKDIVFIKRTLEALRQYDQYKADLQQSYARTLFINSCIGLLIIPQSSQLLNNLSNEIITKEKWGIDPRDIEVCTPKPTVKHIARHLRNAIGHNRFECDCSLCISKPIEKITFNDIDIRNEKKVTFKTIIQFEDFRDFVLKVADHALTKMVEK